MTFLRNKIFLTGASAALILVILGLGYWEQTKDDKEEISIEKPPVEVVEVEAAPQDIQQFAYPDDYALRADEVPAGFELESLGEEAKRLGFTSNPGFFNNEDLYEVLYDNSDPSRIKSIYVSAYVKPSDPATELGIFVVQYTSAEDLNMELPKIALTGTGLYPGGRPVFLKGQSTLVIIWSDTKNYRMAMEEIALDLERRLRLVQVGES